MELRSTAIGGVHNPGPRLLGLRTADLVSEGDRVDVDDGLVQSILGAVCDRVVAGARTIVAPVRPAGEPARVDAEAPEMAALVRKRRQHLSHELRAEQPAAEEGAVEPGHVVWSGD